MLLSALIIGMGSAAPSDARPASTNMRSFYIYRTNGRKWCALRSHRAFNEAIGEASQFEDDEIQIWISGGRPVRLTEFRMDADAEWSITSTYNFDSAGHVSTVRVVLRSGDPLTDRVFKFNVAKGAYRPAVPRVLSPEIFRKAGELASFPFSHLIRRLAGGQMIDKLCDR
jgi:hypothetical protein